ncbi:MAG: hypothetical protein Q9P14_05090 [candidate division KSB1 bacterium]|nr:hypothetical protein [candidate division KSB1 bacterium]
MPAMRMIVSALSGKVANLEITKTSGDAGTNTLYPHPWRGDHRPPDPTAVCG